MYIKDTDKLLFINAININTFLYKTFGNLKTTFGDIITAKDVEISFYRWANKGSELNVDDDSMKENVI
jgi:hypothetical protein